MKRFATAMLMLVCITAGVANWLDLVNYTDFNTGFVTYGSYWLRYALLGMVLLLAVLASFMVPSKARPAAGCAPVQGLLFLVLGVLMAYLSGLRLFEFSRSTRLGQILTVLYLLSGIWFLLLGRSRLSSKNETPTRSSFPAVLGTLSLALLTIQRFCLAPTGVVRVGVTFSSLAALAGLLYAVAQAKEVFLRRETGGWWVYFTGMVSFLLGTCMALPTAVGYYMLDKIQKPVLMEAAALGVLGLCGLATAFSAAARPAVSSSGEKKQPVPQSAGAAEEKTE